MFLVLSLLECSSGIRFFLKPSQPNLTDTCARQFSTTAVCLQRFFEVKLPKRQHFAPKLSPQALYQARHAEKLDLSGYKCDEKNDLLYKYTNTKAHAKKKRQILSN
jgi:hypothetical protein